MIGDGGAYAGRGGSQTGEGRIRGKAMPSTFIFDAGAVVFVLRHPAVVLAG